MSDGLGGTSMATLSTGGAESSGVGLLVSSIVGLSGPDDSTLSLVISSSSSIFTESATGIVLGKLSADLNAQKHTLEKQ